MWRKSSPPPEVINTAPLFGERFSLALRDYGGELAQHLKPGGVAQRWMLETAAYESGLDHLRENSHGYRGLWQMRPPYNVTDPAEQTFRHVMFWLDMIRRFDIGEIPSREAFYAINLAPALLRAGKTAPDTVLYDKRHRPRQYRANINLDPIISDENGRVRLDQDGAPLRKGWIAISDLGPKLGEAAKIYAPRIERELAALVAVGVPRSA